MDHRRDDVRRETTVTPAFLFDLDGTLTDDDDLHFECMRTAFAAQGVTLNKAAFDAHVVGKLNADIAAYFLPHLPPQEGRRVLADKEADFRTRVGETTLNAGALALLDFARAHAIAVGLVTNAPRANADALLGAFGVRDRFQAVVTGDDVARGKPDPGPYLLGLRLLGADAARALAFEDSVAGATAAVKAGLTTVGVGHESAAAGLRKVGVAQTVRDFADPQVMEIARRVLRL